MDQEQLRTLLDQVRSGSVDVDAAIDRLKHLPYEDLGFAKVDHHRALRNGIPEVVFGKGKTPEQVLGIVSSLVKRSGNVLVTRASAEMAGQVKAAFSDAEYFPASGALRIWRDRAILGKGKIALVCAGTGDLPVAEEALVTAEDKIGRAHV